MTKASEISYELLLTRQYVAKFQFIIGTVVALYCLIPGWIYKNPILNLGVLCISLAMILNAKRMIHKYRPIDTEKELGIPKRWMK